MKAFWLAALVFAVCALVSAVVIACGDDDDDDDDNDDNDDGGDDDNGGDYETFCTDLCQRLEECLGEDFDEVAADVEACIGQCQADSDPEGVDCILENCDDIGECDDWLACLGECDS